MGILESFALTIFNLSSFLTWIMQWVAGILFWIGLLVLLPLSLIQKVRGFTGVVIFFSAEVFYVYLWLHCVSTSFTVTHWGVALAGAVSIIGSIPVAVVGSIFEGSWLRVGGYALGFLIALGFKTVGGMFGASAERVTK